MFPSECIIKMSGYFGIFRDLAIGLADGDTLAAG
jgi:hypothetical protein